MEEQQKTHRGLGDGTRGEAPRVSRRGAESMGASPETERPSFFDDVMERVCDPQNLTQALKRVKANKGAPGVDGMTVQQLAAYLKSHGPEIRERILRGEYRPQPVRRVEIPKPDGGVRKLGLPTVLDRLVQQALMQVLQDIWDPTFSSSSHGFRPGRSAHHAIAAAQGYIQSGHGWVVDLDLEKVFDRVNHDILMSRIARRIRDKRVLKLIRAFLTAGVLENGLVGATDEGTPQGGPLSLILSNILLDDLDRELERRGLSFVRYADDCNVYVRSQKAGLRVMEGLKAFLITKLKLKVNESKSAVAHPVQRKFLGVRFIGRVRIKRAIAPQSLARFKARVLELTYRSRGVTLDRMVAELRRYLTGWKGYFGYCETPSTLKRMDEWVRRRLRCYLWKQLAHSKCRFRELTQRGVKASLAAQTVGSPHGAWRLSCSPALSIALPIRFFEALGLPSLSKRTD